MTRTDFVLRLNAPTLVGVDRPFVDRFDEVHEELGTAGYFLVGLQMAGGLFHYYMLRDDTFARMVPVLRAKPKELR